MISVTTKVILTIEDVITGTLKAISATTKMMLATKEVITVILKVISATTKDIDSPVLLLEANSKYVLNLIIIGIDGA